MVETNKTTRSDIYRIDPRNIIVKDGFNSRIDFGDIEELASQIAKDGVLNPIHVQKFKDIQGNEKFYLVDGERRYRAIMHNIKKGLEVINVPAIIVNGNTSEEDLIRIQIQCNEGKNFTEYEYGIAYGKLRDLGKSISEICEIVGKPLWHVNVCLAHLNRDEKIQELMNDGKITGSDVRRVYQANSDDSKSVEDILELERIRKEREAQALAEQKAQEDELNALKNGNNSDKETKAKIKNLKDKQKETNRKIKAASRISLTDLDLESNTRQAKDSLVIKQGLLALKKYLDPKRTGKLMSNVNIDDMLARLVNGEYINVIISNYDHAA